MTKWTTEDQHALDVLAERKKQFMAVSMPALNRVVDDMLIDEINSASRRRIADIMVTYAGDLRDALAPFDKGRVSARKD